MTWTFFPRNEFYSERRDCAIHFSNNNNYVIFPDACVESFRRASRVNMCFALRIRWKLSRLRKNRRLPGSDKSRCFGRFARISEPFHRKDDEMTLTSSAKPACGGDARAQIPRIKPRRAWHIRFSTKGARVCSLHHWEKKRNDSGLVISRSSYSSQGSNLSSLHLLPNRNTDDKRVITVVVSKFFQVWNNLAHGYYNISLNFTFVLFDRL